MRYFLRCADTMMKMMLKTVLLVQVLLHTVTAVLPTETEYGVSVVYCYELRFAMAFGFRLTQRPSRPIRNYRTYLVYKINRAFSTPISLNSLMDQIWPNGCAKLLE